MTEVSNRGAWWRRSSRSASAIALAAIPAGCGRGPIAPSFSVFGSYFPAWIVCTLAGLVVTLVVRAIFVKTGLDEHLPVRMLVYVALTLLTAIALWAVFFAGVTA
jgi:hypothetical protein